MVDSEPWSLYPRVISIGIVWRADELLVGEGRDRVKGTNYYRPLGGGVDLGESAESALRREFVEEVGFEIEIMDHLAILENIFTLDDRRGHEVVFVFEAAFKDPAAYEGDGFTVTETPDHSHPAVWRTLRSFDDANRLVPEPLMPLLAGRTGFS